MHAAIRMPVCLSSGRRSGALLRAEVRLGHSITGLEPVKRVARMLKRHREGGRRYVQHAITHGVAEGLNSKIMTSSGKPAASATPRNFTTAVYFQCDGLDVYALVPEETIIERARGGASSPRKGPCPPH